MRRDNKVNPFKAKKIARQKYKERKDLIASIPKGKRSIDVYAVFEID